MEIKIVKKLIKAEELWSATVYANNLPEPQRAKALEIILIYYTNTANIKEAQKIAKLLGRPLNRGEIRVILAKGLADGNLKTAQWGAKNLDRTLTNDELEILIAHHVIEGDVWRARELVKLVKRQLTAIESSVILESCNFQYDLPLVVKEIVISLKDSDRRDLVELMIERYLKSGWLESARKLAELLDRSLTREELLIVRNKYIADGNLDLTRDRPSIFLDARKISELLGMELSFEETLTTLRNKIVVKHSEKEAMKIAMEFEQPQREQAMTFILNCFIELGDLQYSQAAAKLLKQTLTTEQLLLILRNFVILHPEYIFATKDIAELLEKNQLKRAREQKKALTNKVE